MPVILVNKVHSGSEKNNQKKMEGRGGGEAQGFADPKKMIGLMYVKLWEIS
jgi:hypothetical protein